MLQIDAGFPPLLIEPLLKSRCRYVILHGGRGGGKSWAIARALLIRGIETSLRILCVREFMSSVSDSVHKLLADQIYAMGLQHFYTVEKGSIFGLNKTEFRFAGIRNNVSALKSYEGIDIAWAEESHNITKTSWSVLIPTIRKADSQIIVSFNPELETDETYQRFVVNPPPDSIVRKINFADNPWFPEVLAKEAEYMRENDPDSYQNIWLGFPRIYLDNAIYGGELRNAQAENRITRVPYDPLVSVSTFWDLGRADSTAIIIAQVVAMEFRIIDYIEDCGKPIHDYLKMLQAKPYVYDTDYLPHDAQALTLGSKRSIEEIMRLNGRKVQIVPRLKVEDGINAARMIFPNLYIDEVKCAQLIQCLRKYRWDMEGVRPKPIHDASSHGADAFRYLAIALKPPKAKPKLYSHAIVERATGWMN